MFKELFTESRNEQDIGTFIAKEMHPYLVNGRAKGNGIVTLYTKGNPLKEISAIFMSKNNGTPYKDKDTDAASNTDDYMRNAFTAKRLKTGWKISKTYGAFKQYEGMKLQDDDLLSLLKATRYKG
jgi:hypothetical protein